MPVTGLNLRKVIAGADNKISAGRLVEYEQHGKPILAVAVVEKKGKWTIVNPQGAELHLPANRLYLVPGEPIDSTANRATFLSSLTTKATKKKSNVPIEEVWNVTKDAIKDYSTSELTELAFQKDSPEAHLATRWALLMFFCFFCFFFRLDF